MERETVNHRYDVLDETDGDDVVIARGVTAKTASELTGVSVAWIEKRVAKDGELSVTGLSPEVGLQELVVRLSDG